jgi:hypothetical protein
VEDDLDVGVDLGDRLLGRESLGLVDVADAVDDLALEVGLVDGVELGDAERADPCGCEVEQGGRAQATGADHEHLGVLQALLTRHAHVGDDQVAAVATHLVDGELGGGLDERGERHGDSFMDPTSGAGARSRNNRWDRIHVPATASPGLTTSRHPDRLHTYG